MSVTPLSAEQAAIRVDAGLAVIVDIREADEFARSHIRGSRSLPISKGTGVEDIGGKSVIFTCRSGARTAAHCGRLAESLEADAYMIDGGLDAWRKAGLPVEIDRGAPLELMRQVQIAAGSLVLIGVILGWFVAPAFFALAAFVGAGLTFAGATGFCGMARLLASMPWNRRVPG